MGISEFPPLHNYGVNIYLLKTKLVAISCNLIQFMPDIFDLTSNSKTEKKRIRGRKEVAYLHPGAA
ncbi:hypothetical protein Fmac_028988 [Flemingia macrophylla]|uniref:Uncharacterized protein n=1 Tax=Flemingia macrophylla TaxID=520843 RepID=A0ABD1L922_9FABA